MKYFRNPNTAVLLTVVFLLLCWEINRAFSHSLKNSVNNGERVNILLLGIDARPGEEKARSDTIVMASIDNKIQKAVLLWIPRDTRIPTTNKSKKINMVAQLQGPDASCKAVAKLLGTDIDYYILTNFSGFEKIIDLLGGVYMDVDINLSSDSSGIYLQKGYHRLSGSEALKYARYRGKQDGDIGRTVRQQKLLRAIVKQILKIDTILKIPDLMLALKENVQTNISVSDMLYLANLLVNFDESNIITQTLPGYAYTDPNSGASYWEADHELSLSIIDSLFQGYEYDVNLNSPWY